MDFDGICRAIAAERLTVRGAFHPEPEDVVPTLPDGFAPGTLVMVGFVGRVNWPPFVDSPEAKDGGPNPLDRWSSRVVSRLAAALGAVPLFPFGGPPWLPFQRWARRAEGLHQSPIGLFIHPEFGLWHSYRGALAFEDKLDLPNVPSRPSPCDSCLDKPCLSACPVEAFQPGAYDVPACKAHIAKPAGQDCMELGCRARRACPVGAEHRYAPDQALFYMKAFRGSGR